MTKNPIEKVGERSYEIDLLRISGDGSFNCPSCGISISPDDESKATYSIVEPMMKGGELEALEIKCKCGCNMKLREFLGGVGDNV